MLPLLLSYLVCLNVYCDSIFMDIVTIIKLTDEYASGTTRDGPHRQILS